MPVSSLASRRHPMSWSLSSGEQEQYSAPGKSLSPVQSSGTLCRRTPSFVTYCCENTLTRVMYFMPRRSRTFARHLKAYLFSCLNQCISWLLVLRYTNVLIRDHRCHHRHHHYCRHYHYSLLSVNLLCQLSLFHHLHHYMAVFFHENVW